MLCPAQLDRTRENRLEYRLSIGWRACDDSENLEDGLVGESLEERNLGGRERTGLCAVYPDSSNGVVTPKHRHIDRRPPADLPCDLADLGHQGRVCLHVDDLADRPRQDCRPPNSRLAGPTRRLQPLQL